MIAILPVRGLPEIGQGDDLAALIAAQIELEDGDVVVVAQKVVSKAEGRVVALDGIEPSANARELAGDERDPREVEVILREAKRIVRERAPLVIAETHHGFVCASAGVDHSNAPDPGTLVLLPLDPDASARRLRAALGELRGEGCRRDRDRLVRAPVPPRHDRRRDRARRRPGAHRPARDPRPGRLALRSSLVAVADQIAGAADLVRGKAERRARRDGSRARLWASRHGRRGRIEPEFDLFATPRVICWFARFSAAGTLVSGPETSLNNS